MKVFISLAGFIIGLIVSAGIIPFQAEAYPAYYPQGKIQKRVRNQTSGSRFKDHLTARPGDILVYEIVVSNAANPAPDGMNDMLNVVLTDEMPDGVDPLSGSRRISEELGFIGAREVVAIEIPVIVTADVKFERITNTACITADSLTGEFPQDKCNSASFSIRNPVTVEQPAAEPNELEAESDMVPSDIKANEEIIEAEPIEPIDTEIDADEEVLSADDEVKFQRNGMKSIKLPDTGPENLFAAFIAVTITSYFVHYLKHKQIRY